MTTVSHLSDLLSQAAQVSPHRTALVDAGTGERRTWAELDAEVDRVARGLFGLGVVAGYRVMVALPNRLEFVTAYLGALRAGTVAVPVNPRSTTGELVRMVADSGARVVVADSSTLTTTRSAVAGLEDALMGADEELRARAPVPRIVVVDAPALPTEIRFVDLPEPTVPSAEPGDPEALAVLLYTSGASGTPRAVMLTHRALLANVDQAAAVDPPVLLPEDVVLGVLPLFHVYGLNAVLGQVLRRQACLVITDGFDAEGTLEVIERESVTVVPVAPPVFAHWRDTRDLDERLAGVRVVLSGSAPLAPEPMEDFERRARIPVHQGYGLTEAAPAVTSTQCSAVRKHGSVGAALPGVEIRLVDPTGQVPPGSDPGEIQIRGANLFSGYWPEGDEGPGEDGWWATGDVGFLDADGDLFLADRLKDVVIVSGFNVYPVEVEETIAELDSVASVAVVGVDDPVTGQAVVAYVAPRTDSSLAPDELAEEVRDHCAHRLARFKRPSVVKVVDELPQTPTGKIAKGRLRATERRRLTGLLE